METLELTEADGRDLRKRLKRMLPAEELRIISEGEMTFPMSQVMVTIGHEKLEDFQCKFNQKKKRHVAARQRPLRISSMNAQNPNQGEAIEGSNG